MSSSVGRNSLIMASGTAASRITGQIRTILLAAAIGTTGLAANAYQAGSMIPQVIYTLVSGGIFNAVLVPHIVRTLKSKDAEDQLNKLVTFAVLLLGTVTVLIAVTAPLITRLYVAGSPELISLTYAFTLWCTPQIFFYGLYTVLGQILAVQNRFGAYAWSSVGANIISCIGFVAFIAMFGDYSQSTLNQWDTTKIMLTAGTWTLGVAFQALVLFIPLMRSGFKYRFKFGIRGIGLRTMGPIAAWSLGIVVMDQIANIVITRVLTSAPMKAAEAGIQSVVAGNASYQNAYTIYMLPYSLIAVSVATAIFPRISRSIAERNIDQARAALSNCLRNVGLIMFFFTAVFIAMSHAIVGALLPTVSGQQTTLIATTLTPLCICLPLSSAYLIIQRTFYAFEDGRSPFIFMAILYAIELALIGIGIQLISPNGWSNLVAICLSASYIIAFIPLVLMLRKRFDGRLDGRRLAQTYGKAFIAAIITIIVGVVVSNLLSNGIHLAPDTSASMLLWINNIIIAAIGCIVMLATYVGLLKVMRCQELNSVTATLQQRFKHKPEVAPSEPLNELEELNPAVPSELEEPPIVLQDEQTTGVGRITKEQQSPIGVSPQPSQGYMPYESEEYMRPHLGDTVLNRFTLVSPLREEAGLQAWKANDRVLARDCQLFIVSNTSVLESTNALAGTLASSKDTHFTPVIQIQHDGKVAVVLTQLDAGLSITEYLRSPKQLSLSYEAMRAIIAQAADAVIFLQHDHLTHHALSTDTIRLTKNGVQLADTTISAALADTSGANPNDTAERRAIRQLAAVLYGMLTRTTSTLHPQFSLDELPEDTPTEFYVIVKRGLELIEDGGKKAVPLVTLAELQALLGPTKPFHMLTRRDIRFPSTDGNCSIVRALIQPALPGDILPLPASLISSQALPSIPFAPADGTTHDEVLEDEELGEATQALSESRSFKALWNHSKALMDGSDYTDNSESIPEIQPEDATEMFSAFDPNSSLEPPMQPMRLTVPLDVSKVRNGAADPTDGVSSTGRIPVIDESGNVIPIGSESQRALEQEQAAIDATYVMGTPALPPSFAPQDTHSHSIADSAVFEENKTKSKTRKTALIVCIIAVAVALGFAIHSIATTGSFFGMNKQETYWPNMDLNNVPFGQRTGEDVESPKNNAQTEQTPEPSPTQSTQNTTPYTVANQSFLNQPNGQQGYGYYLHLAQKENVSRVVIKINSSGGKGYIRVNTTGDPTAGEQVAEFTFADGGTTEVKLDKAVETQDVVMWVPMDSLPGNQLFINSVQVY